MKVTSLSASGQEFCYDANFVNAGLLQSPYRSGNFLLKNGSTSTWTVYNQECGIFVDDLLYIPLKMSKQLFTAREAEIYYSNLDAKVPDLYQIVRLKLAVEQVNSSLKKVGMEDFVIPTDVLKNVWYKEAMGGASSAECRRCVVILEREGYQKPSYQQINSSCLLFADTILYHRTEECYEPISPVLVLSWSGIDFLCANVGNENYVFYRGKDHKLVFLGIGCDIKILNDELIHISKQVYHSHDGKLHDVCYVDDNIMNYSYDKNANQVVISYEEEYCIEGIPECIDKVYCYLQKNENGVFVEVDRKYHTIYERSKNY